MVVAPYIHLQNYVIIFLTIAQRRCLLLCKVDLRLLPRRLPLPSPSHPRLRIHLLAREPQRQRHDIHYLLPCEVPPIRTPSTHLHHGRPPICSPTSNRLNRRPSLRLPDTDMAYIWRRKKLHSHSRLREEVVYNARDTHAADTRLRDSISASTECASKQRRLEQFTRTRKAARRRLSCELKASIQIFSN